MTLELHRDRERAEGFGAFASDYDRFRPACAAALLDDLAAPGPARTLDVACGTGGVTAELARRGLDVMGVELDGRMAQLARRRGVAVEVAAFETWDDAGRRFDLVTCSNAWHWLDPGVAIAKAARLLRRGGTLARFWSFDVVEEPLASRLEAIYGEHAPAAHRAGVAPPRDDAGDPLASSGAFTALETRIYRWQRILAAEDWAQLVATFSDHQRLGAERLAALQRALRAAIDALGGSVRSNGITHARLARVRDA